MTKQEMNVLEAVKALKGEWPDYVFDKSPNPYHFLEHYPVVKFNSERNHHYIACNNDIIRLKNGENVTLEEFNNCIDELKSLYSKDKLRKKIKETIDELISDGYTINNHGLLELKSYNCSDVFDKTTVDHRLYNHDTNSYIIFRIQYVKTEFFRSSKIRTLYIKILDRKKSPRESEWIDILEINSMKEEIEKKIKKDADKLTLSLLRLPIVCNELKEIFGEDLEIPYQYTDMDDLEFFDINNVSVTYKKIDFKFSLYATFTIKSEG